VCVWGGGVLASLAFDAYRLLDLLTLN
jgi:hypothetical protein